MTATTKDEREAIQQELLQLADQNEGRLTPEQVVDAASEYSSPLHCCFTWDDTEAARRWRLEEARSLIRTVVVTMRGDGDTTIVIPAMVHDPNAGDRQGYIHVLRLKDDAEAAAETMRREFSWAASCLDRAEKIAFALGLDGDVQRVKKSLERVRKRVERAKPQRPQPTA